LVRIYDDLEHENLYCITHAILMYLLFVAYGLYGLQNSLSAQVAIQLITRFRSKVFAWWIASFRQWVVNSRRLR